MRRILVFAAAVALLAGCASPQLSPQAKRRKAYEGLLTFIEPGMTRRQLYALLPPRRPPTMVPSIFFIIGSIDRSPHLQEEHSLDPEFSLLVEYQDHRPRKAVSAQPSKAAYTGAISPNAIDALLFGMLPPVKTGRSKENPDDLLYSRPRLRGPAAGVARTVLPSPSEWGTAR